MKSTPGRKRIFRWHWFATGQGAQLKSRFEAEFESLARRICDAPQKYAVNHLPDIRQARMRHFPYSIHFRETAEGIEIVLLAHSHRRPSYWPDRV